MAKNEELPIFLDTYAVLTHLLDLVPRLPKVYRYNVGQRMLDACLDMIGLEFEANSQYGAAKVPLIDRLLNRLSMLRMLLRQMMEHKVIDSRQLALYILLMDKIGKQANGWKKHYSE